MGTTRHGAPTLNSSSMQAFESESSGDHDAASVLPIVLPCVSIVILLTALALLGKRRGHCNWAGSMPTHEQLDEEAPNVPEAPAARDPTEALAQQVVEPDEEAPNPPEVPMAHDLAEAPVQQVAEPDMEAPNPPEVPRAQLEGPCGARAEVAEHDGMESEPGNLVVSV